MAKRIPDLQQRLASWQDSVGMAEPSAEQRGAAGRVRERTRARHSTLRGLLLDTVEDLDTSYFALNEYLDQDQEYRSPLHAAWLDERTAAALERYDWAVARVLEMAMHEAQTDSSWDKSREVIKTVYVQPPPKKGWFWRLFR